jgi:putative transposase
MKGHVAKDHVHLLISLPPQVTISPADAVAERPDGTPPAGRVPAPEEAVLGRHLWAGAYFRCPAT